ncbi:MAG: hypothetical protein SGI71_11115 [Verrucomicrobiota bacterium]|nr:hypothetical protein [Verrucomicrobiota bacterium]
MILRFVILYCIIIFSSPLAQAQEKITETNGTTTVILNEENTAPKPYDPYARTRSDSAKDPRLRKKENEKLFPDAMKKEQEEKERRAAMSKEEKDLERKLVDKTPPLQKKISKTATHSSIPKRF